MTDFIADLETELVDAARRRATRRRPLPRPRLVPVVAAIVIALAALAALRAVESSRTADDQAAPPPGPGVVVIVPAAEKRTQRTAACERDEGWTSYAPAAPALSVFTRPQQPGDLLPWHAGLVPAPIVDAPSMRKVGEGHVPGDVHLVPVAGIGRDCGDDEPFASGVCLVEADEFRFRCFTDGAIDAGKAIVATRPGSVYGIVPDGTGLVTLSWQGGSVDAAVIDNTYFARLDGLTAGDSVRIQLHAAPKPEPAVGCAPSAATYAAVPALREGAKRAPTRTLEEAMHRLGSLGAWRAHARRVTTRETFEVWVVPDLPCDRQDLAQERVCVMLEGGPLHCATLPELRRRGTFTRYRKRGRTYVAGIAPPGTRGVRATVIDIVQPLSLRGGVFGAMLIAREREPVRLEFR